MILDQFVMKYAVTLEQVAKIYRVPTLKPWQPARRVEALRDVTFHCPEKKITCLLGPNGAGKTTIIKILAGLIKADRGEATVLNVSLGDLNRETQKKIGLLAANDRSFYWRLTGRQNLDFFASLHGMNGKDRRKRVREVLAEVGLQEQADKPFRLYSSGMKQKLLMARALLGQPSILLLDEPTTHLDPNARAATHRFIKNELIRTRKASVILCTNDLSEAQYLADHLVLIDRGIVLAEGTLESVRSGMQTDRRLVMEFEKKPAEKWHRDLGIEVLQKNHLTVECRIHDEDTVSDIIEAAVFNGGKLLGCHVKEASLTEIFSRFTEAEQ